MLLTCFKGHVACLAAGFPLQADICAQQCCLCEWQIPVSLANWQVALDTIGDRVSLVILVYHNYFEMFSSSVSTHQPGLPQQTSWFTDISTCTSSCTTQQAFISTGGVLAYFMTASLTLTTI